MPSQKKALTVGLIGENPNDSRALTALLQQRYAGQFAPVPLAKECSTLPSAAAGPLLLAVMV